MTTTLLCDDCGREMGCQISRGADGEMREVYYCPHLDCRDRGGIYRFDAYGYVVTIQPFDAQPGQWIAEIDGVNHSYETYEFYPSQDAAIVSSLRWQGTCCGFGAGADRRDQRSGAVLR